MTELEDPTKVSTRAKEPDPVKVTKVGEELEDPTKISVNETHRLVAEEVQREAEEQKEGA